MALVVCITPGWNGCLMHSASLTLMPRPGVWNLPETLHHADWSLYHVEIPGNCTNHFLLDDVVRSRDCKVQGRRAGYGSKRVMWRHAHRHGFGHGSDLLCFQQSAAMADVR